MIKGKIDENLTMKVYAYGLVLGFLFGLMWGYAIWGLR